MYKSLFYVSLLISFVSAKSVTVLIEQGTIVGQTNDGYDTYFGIPFATVNESNPFGNSIGPPRFETPFIANDSSTLCPQVIFKISGTIQCLRLNIYVPKRNSTNSRLAVFVWFHGGGFAFGSSGEYGGQHLVKEGIIVVTVNYRQGPYGFLCLRDSTVPGNQGMKDQADALRWIRKNIFAFGGDSDKITIAGESYGGGAVDLHLYSEYDEKLLFDKAIVQSGSIFDEGFYVKPDHEAAIKIAKYLGHNVSKTRAALSLLAEEDPRSVMSAALNLSLPMAVCKEKRYKGVKNFVTSDPFHLETLHRIQNIKIMIGYTSMELLYVYANQTQEFWNKLGDVFYTGLDKNFEFKKADLKALSGILKKFYLGEKPIGPESILELSRASSDFVVNHAMERSINKYMEINATSVYKYMFSYTGGSQYKYINGSGAAHTEELRYLFEWEAPISGAEQQMIRNRMTKLWSNFVKFGDPTPEVTETLPVLWKTLSGSSRPYMNIDVEMSMRTDAFLERMAFWDLFWYNYKKKSIVYDN